MQTPSHRAEGSGSATPAPDSKPQPAAQGPERGEGGGSGREGRGGAGRAGRGEKPHPGAGRRGECQEEEERARGGAGARRASRGRAEAIAARATMATDELASKLSRRLQMEGEGDGEAPEQPGLNGAAAAAAAGAQDEAAEALGSADDELSAKLLRRADLNQGLGEPQSPSRRVFNPYTEFKEFSRKQIKDMEKMFKQ